MPQENYPQWHRKIKDNKSIFAQTRTFFYFTGQKALFYLVCPGTTKP